MTKILGVEVRGMRDQLSSKENDNSTFGDTLADNSEYNPTVIEQMQEYGVHSDVVFSVDNVKGLTEQITHIQ